MKINRFFLFANISLAMAFIFSCSLDDNNTDSAPGTGSYCYDAKFKDCDRIGPVNCYVASDEECKSAGGIVADLAWCKDNVSGDGIFECTKK